MTEDRYMPKDERVRDRYLHRALTTGSRDNDPGGTFDRWLANIRKQAWEQGYQVARNP